MADTAERIEELEALVREARQELRAAEAALKEAKLEAAPVKVGDVVISQKWGECRVTHVDVRFGRPWVRGNSRNKNGEWSKAVRHLYGGWSLPGDGGEDDA